MIRSTPPPALGFAVMMAAAFVTTPLARQQAPVFRGGTETVAIYATALDRYGEMVLNLKRDDFIVEDDGRRQELSLFVEGLQPITAAVLIDTSASMTLNLELAKIAAEQFVIRMLPGDRVRVGSFADRLDLSREFTTDRDELLRAIRVGLHVGNPTKLWDAVDETMTKLAPLGGRRIVLLLTDGGDTASALKQTDVLERAREDELMIYIVQFRSTARAALAELPLSPTGGAAFSDPRRRNPSPTEALRRLARQTGGGHFLLYQTDDVNATFTRVMQELHYQYVLGFMPQKPDGRVHTLTVRVTRPGLEVRARQSYRAVKPDGTVHLSKPPVPDNVNSFSSAPPAD
jgi:Ca-activated chloride channel family protein